MSSTDIILSESEVVAITGYEQATKQLKVLHDRGWFGAEVLRGDYCVAHARKCAPGY